ncbi:Rieske 2Fe-2S domain-containing protein [Streptomyces sp. NPDC001255]|uniref:Rieske 2Fe-2S domain-containing protein n=1 Tax=Streptomyces sp. NPDC001255 TaxID=3364550 RepID=UPI003685C97A
MGLSRAYGSPLTEGPTPASASTEAPPLPYPSGWAALAFSEELPVGKVLTRPLAGEDVVLYRLRSGELRAIRPYCPHLGAHLGLAKLEGDDLVCPFHAFAFAPDGTCVRTGYDTPPPRSPLSRRHVLEANGAVFVWHHHEDHEPYWTIPAWHELGHRPARYAAWEFSGHAQEVIENSVDYGHFATLHGWKKAEVLEPLTYDGDTFHLTMRATESAPLIGDFTVDVDVHGYGLGCLHADMYTPRMGMRMCTMILPTAIGPHRMQFRQRNRVAFSEPARLPAPVAKAVSRTAARVFEGLLFKSNIEFTAADFPIWDSKKYVQPPKLGQGDGPIGPFRRWAKRFYPPEPASAVVAARDAEAREGAGRVMR